MDGQTQQHVRHGVDAVALTNVGATLVGLLPSIAAGLSVIWGVFRLVEMITGKTIHELVKAAYRWIAEKVFNR